MGSLNPNSLGSVQPGSGSSFCVHSGDIYQPIAQHTVIAMTAAQIIGMNATPFTLLPALATGQTYAIDAISFIFTAGTVAFTGGGALTVAYSGGAAVANTLAAAVITSASSSVTMRESVDATATAAAAITITNASAPFAAGNGTLQVDISYRIVGAY